MNVFSKDKALAHLSLTNPIYFLALGFGLGLMAKAPGTFGTLAAIPLYLLMAPLSIQWYLGLTLLSVIAGFYICGKAAKNMGVHDHGAIVWDEMTGLLITMIGAPAGWLWLVIGFALFRFFDILKPWPIRWLDAKIKGGFGIMIDDVLAGIFSLACLHGVVYYFS